jgi:hypothetical protein
MSAKREGFPTPLLTEKALKLEERVLAHVTRFAPAAVQIRHLLVGMCVVCQAVDGSPGECQAEQLGRLRMCGLPPPISRLD